MEKYLNPANICTNDCKLQLLVHLIDNTQHDVCLEQTHPLASNDDALPSPLASVLDMKGSTVKLAFIC